MNDLSVCQCFTIIASAVSLQPPANGPVNAQRCAFLCLSLPKNLSGNVVCRSIWQPSPGATR